MKNKLMNPMVDFAFKELFGSDEEESKIILKSLINAVINPPEGKEIVEIVHLNPYNNKKYEDDKLSIMDIKVRNQDNELFDIEVQINEMNDFRKRSLYYWSRLYGETISNAGKYMNLKKCVVISLLDFKLFKENDNYHNIFKVKEKDQEFLLVDDLEIHYIELPKFKLESKDETTLDKWLRFIEYAGENRTNELLEMAQLEEVYRLAANRLKKLSADEIKQQEYYAREKAWLDKRSTVAFFEEKERKAVERGLKKGIEQGIEQGKLEVARKLLDILDDVTISLKVGISIEQVKNLREE